MARQSLVGQVADELLDRIITGEFPPGATVPGEHELSARHEVSRSVAETVSVRADPAPPPRAAIPEQLVLSSDRYGR